MHKGNQFAVLKINNMIRQEILYQENCDFKLSDFSPVGYVLKDNDDDLKENIALENDNTDKIEKVYGVISISDYTNFYDYMKSGKYLDVTFVTIIDNKFSLSNIIKSIKCNDIIIFSAIYIA